MTDEEGQPPPRFLLRPAGVLTQLLSAVALLIATIMFILVSQNKTGGAPLVVAWAVAAMTGLVLGGLMARGGLVSVLVCATIMATFGTVLLVIDWEQLRSILRLLPESDVTMIADLLVVAAVAMLATSALSLAAIPQARAYHRALREAEAAAEQSGMWQGAEPVSVPVTAPAPRSTAPVAVPPPPAYPSPHAPRPPEPAWSPTPSTAPLASFGRGGAGSSSAHTHPSPAHAPPTRASEIPLPLPAPAPTGDGYAPPRASQPPHDPYASPRASQPPHDPYASSRASQPPHDPYAPPAMPAPAHDPYAPPAMPAPAHDPYVPSSASTAPGWTPAPARTHTTMMIVRPPAVEKRSRRRVFIMLGGLAIGIGAGVGVLVSSMQSERRDALAEPGATSSTPAPPPAPGSAAVAIAPGVAPVDAAPADAAAPAQTIEAFVDQQRDLIGQADLAKLAQTFAPNALGIGLDAEDLVEGRDAIEAMLTKNLGDPPPDGFTVVAKSLAIGTAYGHAWTAEELEISGPSIAPRRFAITQLVAPVNGAWSVVALCWARPVRDETAERRAVLGTLPVPRAVPSRADDAELDAAVRAAFASRRAFADARSERADGFNFGSGPGERVVGGARIKSLFGRLRSELRLDGGARVIASGPDVGAAALVASYTYKGRAAVDVTQKFRVLAVFIREDGAWKIVQTQFSNAGPIDD